MALPTRWGDGGVVSLIEGRGVEREREKRVKAISRAFFFVCP